MNKSIFIQLQDQIDKEHSIREKLTAEVDLLDEKLRVLQLLLANCEQNLENQEEILEALEIIKSKTRGLAELASNFPYYKYNGVWDRSIQKVVYLYLLASWTGRLDKSLRPTYSLLSLSEVGQILQVPVFPEESTFHLSIEQYLHAVLSLCSELARQSVNSVISGNYHIPFEALNTIQKVHSSFQVLSLKNDSLRRHFDGLKYDLKRSEDGMKFT